MSNTTQITHCPKTLEGNKLRKRFFWGPGLTLRVSGSKTLLVMLTQKILLQTISGSEVIPLFGGHGQTETHFESSELLREFLFNLYFGEKGNFKHSKISTISLHEEKRSEIGHSLS